MNKLSTTLSILLLLTYVAAQKVDTFPKVLVFEDEPVPTGTYVSTTIFAQDSSIQDSKLIESPAYFGESTINKTSFKDSYVKFNDSLILRSSIEGGQAIIKEGKIKNTEFKNTKVQTNDSTYLVSSTINQSTLVDFGGLINDVDFIGGKIGINVNSFNSEAEQFAKFVEQSQLESKNENIFDRATIIACRFKNRLLLNGIDFNSQFNSFNNTQLFLSNASIIQNYFNEGILIVHNSQFEDNSVIGPKILNQFVFSNVKGNSFLEQGVTLYISNTSSNGYSSSTVFAIESSLDSDSFSESSILANDTKIRNSHFYYSTLIANNASLYRSIVSNGQVNITQSSINYGIIQNSTIFASQSILNPIFINSLICNEDSTFVPGYQLINSEILDYKSPECQQALFDVANKAKEAIQNRESIERETRKAIAEIQEENEGVEGFNEMEEIFRLLE